MLDIYSAPLQGYTEAPWRKLHNEIFGGIKKYYAPFMRIEHGDYRKKDLRDIAVDIMRVLILYHKFLQENQFKRAN